MTTTDPGVEAAAAALYVRMRAASLAQAEQPALLAILHRVLPEEFEDLDEGRQTHHRSLARAAVDAWRLHTELDGPRT